MEESNSVFYQSRRENETKQKMKFGSVLQYKSLKGKDADGDGDGDGEVTTAAAAGATATTAREMEHMEHILQRHMKPLKFKRKSYFLSRNKQYICVLVRETMTRPDVILQHNNRRDRGVKKKTFLEQIGVHGITKAPCFSVTIIFNIKEQKVITAFPTL